MEGPGGLATESLGPARGCAAISGDAGTEIGAVALRYGRGAQHVRSVDMGEDQNRDVLKQTITRQDGTREDRHHQEQSGERGATPTRSGEQFDGGTEEDEDAGAGFGEGDAAAKVRAKRLPE